MRTGNVEKLGGEGFAFVGGNSGAESDTQKSKMGNGQSSQPKPIQNNSGRDRLSDRRIRCPYCQKEFAIKDLLFRAADPETEKSIMRKTEKGYAMDEINLLHSFKEESDEILKEFWAETMCWGNNASTIREVVDGYAEITVDGEYKGTSIDDVRCHILEDDQIDWGKSRINNGYPMAVTDIRGIETRIKVCPECHCVLPEEYGYYDIFFVACVGKRGSGKTVLLSQFFGTMDAELMVKGGVYTASTSADVFVEQKKVEAGKELPEHTDEGSVKPPIIVTVTNDRERKNSTLVFYDIAGENCVNRERMGVYGFFLENADGVLMLISPEQIPVNIENIDSSQKEILQVINCIGDTYADRRTRAGNGKDANFAIVLSQSDEYKMRNADAYDYMFRQIQYNEDRMGYMIDQHLNLNRNITRMLRRTALMRRVKHNYKKATFFAVSALGEAGCRDQNTGKMMAPAEINPVRLEEPFLWLMWKFGIIRAVRDHSLIERIMNWISGIFGGQGGGY